MKRGRLFTLLIAILLMYSTIVLAQLPSPPPSPSLGSESFQLTIDKVGSGVITELATGLTCEPNCNLVFDSGKSITLNAEADQGFVFTGWSGECSGADSCTVTIDNDKYVKATFTAIQAGAIEDKVQTTEETNLLLYGGIALAVVIFLVVLFILLRKKSPQVIPQTPQTNPQVMQLKEYIQENMKKGYSKEQLKIIMINAGYQQQLIDEAMQLV